MSDLCIYTHNSRLFYRLTKKLKELNIWFTALDNYHDIHATARVLLTTQHDLDKYDPNFSDFLDILIILPHQSLDEIILLTLQHLHDLRNCSTITVAIDPGMEQSGMAFFLKKKFFFSKSVSDLDHVVYWINVAKETYPNKLMTIKIGNGYTRLTQLFLNHLADNLSSNDIQFILVDEMHTSRLKWKKKKSFTTIHEKAAMLIGLREGKITNIGDYRLN